MITVLDLFSGIGGFSLGLERTGGFKTAAFCEIDPFARRVLAKHWPEIPIYDDIKSLTSERLASDEITPGLICGGFPCQPFSKLSRGLSKHKNMWPEMLRVVIDAGPKFVIVENVDESIIRKATNELCAIGYRANHFCISALKIGADHQRDRWWSIAHTYDESEFYRAINAEVASMQEICHNLWGWENYARAVRVPHGVPNRMDRLRCLGNSVLPQIPELIGKAILKLDTPTQT